MGITAHPAITTATYVAKAVHTHLHYAMYTITQDFAVISITVHIQCFHVS